MTRGGLNYYRETTEPLIEIAIGVTFKVSGKWVHAVSREKDSYDDCGDCVFCAQRKEKEFCLCPEMACLEEDRDDCEDVIFKEIEQ